MIRINIPITRIAPFYYATFGAALIMAFLHLMDVNIPLGIWSILILVIISMILGFIDYSISYSLAKEKVKKIDRVEQ